MAKKKDNKKVKVLSNAWMLITLFAVVSIITIFLNLVIADFSDLGNVKYSGIKMIFGYTKEVDVLVGTLRVEILKFNFIAFLMLLLPILGIIVIVLTKARRQVVTFLCGLVFIGAGVLFFLTPEIFTSGIVDKLKDLGEAAFVNGAIKALTASYVGAISLVLAGLTSIAVAFLE